MIISVACCTHITIDGHTITNLYILRMLFYIIMFDLYVICLIIPIACCSANFKGYWNSEITKSTALRLTLHSRMFCCIILFCWKFYTVHIIIYVHLCHYKHGRNFHFCYNILSLHTYV